MSSITSSALMVWGVARGYMAAGSAAAATAAALSYHKHRTDMKEIPVFGCGRKPFCIIHVSISVVASLWYGPAIVKEYAQQEWLAAFQKNTVFNILWKALRTLSGRTQIFHNFLPMSCRPLPEWSRLMAAGAAGEIGGQMFLYPVEVIKVMAQHSSTSAVEVLGGLFKSSGPLKAVQVLFNGAAATAGISALLGSCYLLVFRSSTAFFAAHYERQRLQAQKLEATGNCVGYTSLAQDEDSAAFLAASLTAVLIAVITGPLEMARNRVQSGLVHLSVARYILSGRGLVDTLPFLVPYMLVAVPHDFAELVTVHYASRFRKEHNERIVCPQEVFDAAVGALAGFTGVLLSAPADCIKTKVITAEGGAIFERPDLKWDITSVRSKWMVAARYTWRMQGVRGFFVGIMPRMLDEVPGAMLHWMFVEATLRALPSALL